MGKQFPQSERRSTQFDKVDAKSLKITLRARLRQASHLCFIIISFNAADELSHDGGIN